MGTFELALEALGLVGQAGQFAGLGLGRHQHAVFAPADDRLLHIRKEGAHRVEIPGRDGIELVIVALGAPDGLTHPNRADGTDPIGEVA